MNEARTHSITGRQAEERSGVTRVQRPEGFRRITVSDHLANSKHPKPLDNSPALISGSAFELQPSRDKTHDDQTASDGPGQANGQFRFPAVPVGVEHSAVVVGH